MIQLPESVKALINHVSEEYHLKNLTNPSQVNTIQSLLKLETDVTSLYINLSFEEGPICYKISIQRKNLKRKFALKTKNELNPSVIAMLEAMEKDQNDEKRNDENVEIDDDVVETPKKIGKFSVDNEFTCRFCLKYFSRKDYCKEHELNCHGSTKKIFKCGNCDKCFKNMIGKKAHEVKCFDKTNSTDVNVCPTCDKSFGSHQNLLRHIKSKNHDYPSDVENKYSSMGRELCRICHKYVEFVNLHQEIFHSKTSQGFKCEVCDFQTNRKDTLDRHHYLKHKIVNKRYFEAIDKTFPEDVTFKCGDCKKEFATKLGIENHILLTNCEEIFCSICDKKFKERKSLNQHIKRIHNDKNHYECDKCKKIFRHQSSLYKHNKLCNK